MVSLLGDTYHTVLIQYDLLYSLNSINNDCFELYQIWSPGASQRLGASYPPTLQTLSSLVLLKTLGNNTL